MALHFSTGIGHVFDKNQGKNIADIKYHLIEIDPTIYTRKKWWGDFSTTDKISATGDYRIDMEDGRMGDCKISVNTEHMHKHQLCYNFFGCGKLDGAKT